MDRTTLTVLALAGGLLTPLPSLAEPSFFSEVGLRVGMDLESEINLTTYEIFGKTDLDWSREWGDGYRVELGLETALGAVRTAETTAAYGRIAPTLTFQREGLPVALSLSSGPSLFSESHFGDYSIGGNFHFMTSLGFDWELDDSWSIGCRVVHTSNAHLYHTNPGLDTYAISASHRF